jgi:hypothetical protein
MRRQPGAQLGTAAEKHSSRSPVTETGESPETESRLGGPASALLAQAERALTTVGTTVRHIATAANQAVATKAA